MLAELLYTLVGPRAQLLCIKWEYEVEIGKMTSYRQDHRVANP